MSTIDRKTRMIAFDTFKDLIALKISRKDAIDTIHKEFGIARGTLYDWYREKHMPWGRAGQVNLKAEIFYVLGALMGDGCLYKWKPTNNFVILVGDKKFTTKYSKYLKLCIGQQVKPYIDRNKNIWFVKTNNYSLYELFKRAREDLAYLESLIPKYGKRSILLFIEGFFDAEGCVKIIKEQSRITPKACLDITNTNLKLLELIQSWLLKYVCIEARMSIQKPHGNRKVAYHLRIYRKDGIRKFLDLMPTTKLKKKKIKLVRNWLRK
jgi:intein-encoded DNA endonuclease-like protein